jgi:hypothetical protein
MRSLHAFLIAGALAEQRVLLGRGSTLAGWTLPSPPSSLSLSTDLAPWSNLPYFNISYNFSGGEWQAAISPADEDDLDIPGLLSLSFSVYSPVAGQSMLVSLQDAGYAQRGAWPYLATVGWQNITLSFNSSSWLPKAPGPNLPFPLRGLSIGAGRGNEKGSVGWLGLADISLTTSAAAGEIAHPIVVTLQQPSGLGGGLAVAGSPPLQLGVLALNRLQQPCPSTSISVQLRNYTGPMGNGGEWTLCASTASLDPWESLPLLCSVSPSAAGYVAMRAVFSSSSCWSANDTAEVTEGAIAIVPPQLPYTPVERNLHANVFGGQMEGSAAAAAAIGMLTVRSGPLWTWAQPSECWNLSTCFDWGFYDGILELSAAGIEVMIDAREMCPPWAAARNDSGPTWRTIPGEAHYVDYVRWLGIMFDRYAPIASAVEVSNEGDGLSYFMPQGIPYDYAVNLSLALINLTAAGMANSPAAAGLKLVGLSSSMFDAKQEGNGGSAYLQYERAVLSAPGVMRALGAVSVHPYQNHVWVPWTNPGWGNFSFQFFNESAGGGTNSSTAQLLATAALMRGEAAAAGLPATYSPVLWPSEWGYNLMASVALSEGWAVMHGALVAVGLVHLRSAPLAQYVQKAFYFAADDSCCAESGGFFGLWRSAQRRSGANATQPGQEPSKLLAPLVPLPSVAAFAVASTLLDVASGRLPGVFVVDHSAEGGALPPGGTQLPPTCVAFAPDPASPQKPPPLCALFILGHHFNDRTLANMTLSAPPARIVSGLGASLPAAVEQSSSSGAVVLPLTLAALPQYVILQEGSDAVSACASLTWLP